MFDPMWLWIYAGCALMLMELMVPGFIIFFFGLAAASVGAIGLFVGDAFTASWQVASFSFFTIVYLAGVRRYLRKIFSGKTEVSGTDFCDEYLGRSATVVKAIEPGCEGRILVGDAEWSAIADAPVGEGRTVKIVSRKNLTMKVEETK